MNAENEIARQRIKKTKKEDLEDEIIKNPGTWMQVSINRQKHEVRYYQEIDDGLVDKNMSFLTWCILRNPSPLKGLVTLKAGA